jgi:hypothetical protein
MLGLATSSKQDQTLSLLVTIMADIKALTDAVSAYTASAQKLISLVQPAATELTALRAEVASGATVDPALAALASTVAAQQPALDAALSTMQGAVAATPPATPPKV